MTPATPHIILYTSGTTGFPKGAVFSQGAHYLHAVAWALMTGQRAGDVGLLVYPLFHTGGPDCVLLPHFLVGGTVVLLDGADPQAMLAAIAAHRATTSSASPPSGAACWRRSTRSRPRLRRTTSPPCGAASGSSDTLPPDLLDGILGRFPAEVYVTYGLTEAGCILTYSRLTREDRAEIDSVGRPHPLVEVAVDAPAGEVGEVLARGPTLDGRLLGAAWSRRRRPWPGAGCTPATWGASTSGGALHLAGRAKDMIVSGGEKVYPLEVERLIRSPARGGRRGPGRRARSGVGRVRCWPASCATPDRPGRPSARGRSGLRAPPPGRLQVPPLRGVRRRLPVTSATNKVQKGALRERFRDLGAGDEGEEREWHEWLRRARWPRT